MPDFDNYGRHLEMTSIKLKIDDDNVQFKKYEGWFLNKPEDNFNIVFNTQVSTLK